MVHLLSVTENLHLILRVLYDDMMALCAPLTTVASAIAGIGALLYIAYRVWQSLAQAEPLDIFPLLRPFAIGICILFFPTLVLGSLNGILSPLVQATHSLMEGQTLDMQQWQRQRDELERQSRERLPPDSYYVEDEEMERDLAQLGVDDTTQQTLDRMNRERSSWSVKGLLLKGLTWLLELLFAAAGIILDVLRTFYLIVLSLLGPIAFAISVFDGFQNTLVQWLSKYISIYLWLPISDLFSAVIARLQTLSMRHDAEMMAQDYGWYFDASNTVNVIFMFVAICGYLCIPSIASWVVQANGFSSYNRTISQAMSYVSGGAGWLAGRAWAGTKGAATVGLSYRFAERQRQKIYVLDNGRSLMVALSQDLAQNRPVEAREHVRRFHELFFTLSPDKAAIESNVNRALLMADKSALSYYKVLQEKGFFNRLIAGNVMQIAEVDSIRCDFDRYPYEVTTFARQRIVRESTVTERSLVTTCRLVNTVRSDNNPQGFMIEQLNVIENRDLATYDR